ncbi:TetR/AcrR family transcriptional regulator [Nocardia cyriacigeorgica]|uniref:TetR/AcrR family transcriptional regulator n=1 Tax=Nocardia cyriacigeorgica TaxID=135487 RepID=A0A6P1DB22_9NOCA|nr:TetR/AcrR family transcriptional regulator [Nocardia cyriacigeorgica]NEW42628.1 TetR/AcrR family transcriptional regulator [Nocardia cyriacigeorgica]NEW47697.1 TetR/AcrR family transcriptional regulator [Nocardia cyriacigeorgica]NEW53733.1 TetR/AcrR family transcriptional regulator [Nocardia cyriacigeorgica]
MIGARRPRSPRGAGSQLRSEILAATADLLNRTGNADAVSIRAVGKLVGVSAPSIYRHFADKDELIDAVVAQVFEDLDAAMRTAVDDDPRAHPIVRLHHLGMAYVRFALDHPEQYRLATAPAETRGAVDQVLSSSAFQYFAETVRAAMEEGLVDPGDPTPIVLELWAAAHGIASLLLAKPYLPWGDPMEVAERVLGAACVGHIVMSQIGEEQTPEDVADWFARLQVEKRGA